MKQMTRKYNIEITMKGDICELPKEEAAEYVGNQIQELYPLQSVEVKSVEEEIEEI